MKNDKLHELCKQAGCCIDLMGFGEGDIEGLARLIIQECMRCCTKVEEDKELSDYQGGFRDGALLCREEIKKHFGVEE